MCLFHVLTSQSASLKVTVTVLTLEGFEGGMCHHVLVEGGLTVVGGAAHLTEVFFTGSM